MSNSLRSLMRGPPAVDHAGDLNNHELVRLTVASIPTNGRSTKQKKAIAETLSIAGGTRRAGTIAVQRLQKRWSSARSHHA